MSVEATLMVVLNFVQILLDLIDVAADLGLHLLPTDMHVKVQMKVRRDL